MRIASLIVLCLLSARTASADLIKVNLPNGNIAYVSDGSTTGTFLCSTPRYQCTSTGPSMTLVNGAFSATFTFTGIDATWLMGGVENHILPMGTFDAVCDPGFTFPRELSQDTLEVFSFVLTLSHTAPIFATQSFHVGFGPSYASGGASLPVYGGEQFNFGGIVTFPTFIDPDHGRLAYVYSLIPFSLPAQGQFTAQAVGSVVPEPASVLLLGPALAGLWRRRRVILNLRRAGDGRVS